MKEHGDGSAAERFEQWTEMCAAATLRDCGGIGYCIAAAHALAEFLRQRGYSPELTRVEMRAFPADRSVWGQVIRRGPASGPDMWSGHLVVTCDGYLLDPTAGQFSTEAFPIGPTIARLPAGWADYETLFLRDGEGNQHDYTKDCRQDGWKSKPDARPSHWLGILGILKDLAAAEKDMVAA
jgi:hypothetical protein